MNEYKDKIIYAKLLLKFLTALNIYKVLKRSFILSVVWKGLEVKKS